MQRFLTAAALAAALFVAPAWAQQPIVPDGPIAFIGHGAMFDRDGREITPTPEFAAQALAFYREALLGLADQPVRDRFGALEAEVVAAAPEALAAGAPARHVADAMLLDWLVDAAAPADGGRLAGKVNLLKDILGEGSAGAAPQARRSAVDPGVRTRIETTIAAAAPPVAEFAATAGGEAYTQLCRSNGVPIPPDWGTIDWKFRGVLANEFISAGLQAEVFSYRSPDPDGVCIALPRFDIAAEPDEISLLGVICLGRQSGKACFWDNQKNDQHFNPKRGDIVPFSNFGGGTELVGSRGGVCTECHAGENPYVIHPGTTLGLPNLADLPLFPNDWHQPIVQPGWPINPGPGNVSGDCAACHAKGGPGGRLPAVSNILAGYCGAVLDTALERTMPPGAPGSQQCPSSQGSCPPHVQALEQACGKPPASNAWTGAVWRSTGQPCSGASCPGWQKLDNNFRTVAIAAARDNLYQLHYDGAIWRFTGAPCNGPDCFGWEKLDQNGRTVAIAASASSVYQLHVGGAVWRYTGPPCAGASCPGWEKLDQNVRTIAIASASGKLYQLQRDGGILRYTGQPCSGASCPGWERLDNNPATVAIVAHGANGLYQLHGDGKVYEFTGTLCTGGSCPGWRRIDFDREIADISLANGKLQKRQRDGEIFRYDGGSCGAGGCTGWTRIDAFPSSVAIVGGDYQIHDGGALYRSTGAPFGWQRLDDNARTAVGVQAEGVGHPLYQLHAAKLYQRHASGAVWQSDGRACADAGCGGGWQQLDNFVGTSQVAASGGRLFQRHQDGAIYQSTGEPCIFGICNGWRQLDRNPNTKSIASGGGRLYQLHKDGKVWRWNGGVCNASGCGHAWEMIDSAPTTVAIAPSGGQLYQLRSDGAVLRHNGQACTGNACSWAFLDTNPNTKAIASAAGRLYQLHKDGKIWRHRGPACIVPPCAWELLDANAATVAITAGGGEFYQKHGDGKVYEATGAPCNAAGTSCPGWRRLDGPHGVKALAAAGGQLYQLHDSGHVFRSDGRGCTGGSCAGWHRLDNNPSTVVIEAARD